MHLSQRLFNFFQNRELDELYASTAVRSLALSMIAIFIPLFLLKVGYTLSSVFIFQISFGLAHFITTIPAAKFVSRYGFKHTMLFSIPFLIVFYALLYTIEAHRIPLFVLGVVVGISQALFWTAYHIDFSKFSEKDRRGEEIGFARIVSLIFAVIGPAAGGLILSLCEFNVLFIITSALLFLSAVPLFFSQDVHEPVTFSTGQIFRDQKAGDYLGYIGEGMETGVNTVMWPLFIFFAIVGSYMILGLASSISFLASLVFAFVIRRFTNVKRKLVLKIAALSLSGIWILRIFARTIIQVFAIDAAYGMIQTMRTVSFDAISYDKASSSNIVEGIVFREMMIPLGRVILFTILLFSADFVFSFLFGSGSSLLLILF